MSHSCVTAPVVEQFGRECAAQSAIDHFNGVIGYLTSLSSPGSGVLDSKGPQLKELSAAIRATTAPVVKPSGLVRQSSAQRGVSASQLHGTLIFGDGWTSSA
jgi:hypothetical protein